MEEFLVSNLKVGGSRPACAQIFFQNIAGKFRWRWKLSRNFRHKWHKLLENSGGAENSAEISGTNGISFFCYMYESSLRHPVWVPEINVKACNSAARAHYSEWQWIVIFFTDVVDTVAINFSPVSLTPLKDLTQQVLNGQKRVAKKSSEFQKNFHRVNIDLKCSNFKRLQIY